MAKYKTKQRAELIDYLERHHDETLCVQRVYEDLKHTGISLSAVYRNMTELEDEQKLMRVEKDRCSETMYRYAGASDCSGKLHVCCTECGKTIHVSDEQTDALANALSGEDGYSLNVSKTVIYGVCPDCRDTKEGYRDGSY